MLWPDTFMGANFRHPQTSTAQMTSTLSPNMVNEGTFGYSVTGGNNISPFINANNQPEINEFYNLSANGVPVIPQLGTGGVNFQFNQPMGNRGIWPAFQTDKTPCGDLADTLSWTHGAAFNQRRFRDTARTFDRDKPTEASAILPFKLRAIGGDTFLLRLRRMQSPPPMFPDWEAPPHLEITRGCGTCSTTFRAL